MSAVLQPPPELGEGELLKEMIPASAISLGPQPGCVANIISLVTLRKLCDLEKTIHPHHLSSIF